MNFKFFKRSLEGESDVASRQKEAEQPYRDGPQTTADYMKVPSVYRAITLLSARISALGLNYEAYSDGYWSTIDANLNYLLNVEPDSRYTAPNFWKTLLYNMLIRGEAFVIPTRVGNLISSLTLVESRYVSYSDNDSIYHVNDPVNKINADFNEDEILHFINFSFNGKRGKGFQHFAAESAVLASLIDGKAKSNLESADSFVKIHADNPGRINIKEMENVAAKLQRDLGSSASVIIQPQYTAIDSVPVVNVKTGLVEQKVMALHDIARFFNIPPAYLFDAGATNYKESLQAMYQMYEATLPLTQTIEAEFNRKLVPFDQRGLRRFHFNQDNAYSNSEPAYKADYYTKALAAAMLTPNEIRKACNRPPVEGGDHLLVSANLACPDALVAKNHNDAGIASNDCQAITKPTE